MGLLVNLSPMVEHHVKTKGISEDKPIIITERDVEEVISYVERLKRSMLANREEIGAGRCQEIVKLLDEFKRQVEASVGKTFTEALRDSVYYKSKGVIELNVTPAVVVQGETVSITGKALPNEPVWLKSSFALSLPVSDGVYSRDFCGVAVDKTDDSVVVGLCNSSIIKFSKTGSILWIEELQEELWLSSVKSINPEGDILVSGFGRVDGVFKSYFEIRDKNGNFIRSTTRPHNG